MLRFVTVASAVMHVLLRCAHGMSDKQFVYADCAVFSGRYELLSGKNLQVISLKNKRGTVLLRICNRISEGLMSQMQIVQEENFASD